LPRLDLDSWPAARQAKAYRNYAMEYIRNALPLLVELLGPDEARSLGRLCGLQIGMQCYDDIMQRLKLSSDDARGFMDLFEILLIASGDEVLRHDDTLERTRWRLFDNIEVDPIVSAIWCAPFDGLLAVHDRFAILKAYPHDRFALEAKSD